MTVKVVVFSQFADHFFDVSLYSNADRRPGSVIATLGTDLLALYFGNIVVVSGATPILTSGTEYWLVLSPSTAGPTSPGSPVLSYLLPWP